MTVERSHILRNAWLPVITAIGMHIGELLGGALIIESIFSWRVWGAMRSLPL